MGKRLVSGLGSCIIMSIAIDVLVYALKRLYYSNNNIQYTCIQYTHEHVLYMYYERILRTTCIHVLYAITVHVFPEIFARALLHFLCTFVVGIGT